MHNESGCDNRIGGPAIGDLEECRRRRSRVFKHATRRQLKTIDSWQTQNNNNNKKNKSINNSVTGSLWLGGKTHSQLQLHFHFYFPLLLFLLVLARKSRTLLCSLSMTGYRSPATPRLLLLLLSFICFWLSGLVVLCVCVCGTDRSHSQSQILNQNQNRWIDGADVCLLALIIATKFDIILPSTPTKQ